MNQIDFGHGRLEAAAAGSWRFESRDETPGFNDGGEVDDRN
jgi:hypothetical protein